MTDFDGQRLRMARKRRRLSRRDVAHALGVDPDRVQDWERGRKAPAPTVVPRIADLLLVTAKDLERRGHRGQRTAARGSSQHQQRRGR